jgi:hypothetical protein
MKGRWTIAGSIVGAFLLALAVGQAWAQGPQEGVSIQAAPGTAFTYQGQLRQAGSPISGNCDFQFSLWDAAGSGSPPAGGNPIGSTQTKTGVGVSNGYFTIPDLDFGADAFLGEARWLQIAVRCPAGSGEYVTLSPRQPLTAVPYALFSKAAPWAGLIGVPADFADGVDNNTTYTAGTGLTLAGNQFSLDTAYTDGRYWKLTGNAGTTPGTNFLGTTDNQAFEFRVNNARALRLEPNPDSPNVIGGYSGNSVTARVYGATIGGGGSDGYTNVVTGSFSTVGGGRANTAGKWGATVAGGVENEATGESSAIGGGNGNTASAYVATVSGGGSNIASADGAAVGGGMHNNSSADQATIGGGAYNTASNYYATVGGGDSNTASGPKATIGGGSSNTASAYYATVGGGWSNTASGYAAAVPGGRNNTASGDYAIIPGGWQAAATHYGEMAYAAGAFVSSGDAQTSVYVLRAVSSGTTVTELFLDGSSRRLTIASGRTVTFDILVVARSYNGESAGYRIIGVIENVGGNTTLIGTLSKTDLGEDDTDWDVTVGADDNNDALRIQVQGGTSDTVRWVATVRTVEVSW